MALFQGEIVILKKTKKKTKGSFLIVKIGALKNNDIRFKSRKKGQLLRLKREELKHLFKKID